MQTGGIVWVLSGMMNLYIAVCLEFKDKINIQIKKFFFVIIFFYLRFMTIKIYTKEKRQALRLAKEKLTNVVEFDLAVMANKIGISISTIKAYKNGTGNNFETALKIIEC